MGGGLWRPVVRAGFTIFRWRLILKSESLKFLKPSGPLEGLLFVFQPTQLDVMGKNVSFFHSNATSLILRPFVGHNQAIKKNRKRGFYAIIIIFIFVFSV
jgi:hypothetical protein